MGRRVQLNRPKQSTKSNCRINQQESDGDSDEDFELDNHRPYPRKRSNVKRPIQQGRQFASLSRRRCQM